MVALRNIAAAAVIVAAGVFAFFWFFQSDEAKIKKQFKTIAKLASGISKEPELKATAGARKIGGMFADTCHIEIPSHNISNTYARRDISPRILGIRSRYSDISLKFHDLSIRFPEEKIARVVVTAYLEATQISGETVREASEIVCRLEKSEKDWLFKKIEAVSVLER